MGLASLERHSHKNSTKNADGRLGEPPECVQRVYDTMGFMFTNMGVPYIHYVH